MTLDGFSGPAGGGGGLKDYVFVSSGSQNTLTSGETVFKYPFDTLGINRQGNYDTSTYEYSIPETGIYYINLSFLAKNFSNGGGLLVRWSYSSSRADSSDTITHTLQDYTDDAGTVISEQLCRISGVYELEGGNILNTLVENRTGASLDIGQETTSTRLVIARIE